MSKPLQDLSGEALELIAARFRVIGDASRLKLILALKDGGKNVSQLVAASGLGQPNVSKHLRILSDAGIVARRKEGLNAIYSIAELEIFEIFVRASHATRKQINNMRQPVNL